jgi:hypothetical protein
MISFKDLIAFLNPAWHANQHAKLGLSRRKLELANALIPGVPLGNESMFPDGNWTTVYGCNTRKRYAANRSCAYMRLVYVAASGTSETPTSGPMAYSAVVESVDGGTRYPVYFQGKAIGVCSPGSVLVSDPLYMPVTAGQNFWVTTHSEAPNMPFHNLSPTVSAWGEGCDASFNTAASDKTSSGSVGTNSVSHVSPLAVIGDYADGLPYVLHFGDSIATGLGDDVGVATGRGFLRRAMNNTIPFISVSVSGDAYSNTHKLRYQFVRGCTDAIDEMGINEVRNGMAVATLQGNMIAAWQNLAAHGARVWRTTLTLYTSSTDSWATASNQTPGVYEANRVAINDWIRAGAPMVSGVAVAVGTVGALVAGQAGHPLAGYFDVANAVEVNAAGVLTQNGGRWKVGTVYLADNQGLHPNGTGYSLMAAAINTSKFTWN